MPVSYTHLGVYKRQPRAPHCKAQAQHLYGARGENKEGVEHNVDHVGGNVEDQRRARIACAAQDVGTHIDGEAEQVDRAYDGDVGGCLLYTSRCV